MARFAWFFHALGEHQSLTDEHPSRRVSRRGLGMKVMQMMQLTKIFSREAGRRRQRARVLAAVVTFAGGTILLANACGGIGAVPDVVPPETGDVTVDVTFGHELMVPSTASFHVWVVAPKEGYSTSCSKLVAGESDPYDKELEVLADEVFTELDDALEFTAAVGEGFVYVEGVDFSGEATLAGCDEVTVSTEDGANADVTLIAAGSFDCGDSETEDGSPCDDGEFCTTGEVCDGGSCGDGNARDCSSEADDCAAGTCSETEGCMVEPQPDDTECDDGLVCTENDACLDGQCIGSEVQCTGGVCGGAYCDEAYGGCIDDGEVPNGTACDDENVCTVTSTCSYGTCTANSNRVLCPVSTCAPVSDCDATNGCSMNATYASYQLGATCSDNPCMDYVYNYYPPGYGGEAPEAYYAQCDGNGTCVGGVPLPSGVTCNIGCQTGTCDGSGTCDLTANLPDYTSCQGTYPGSTSTLSGSCEAGVCTYY